MALLVKPFGYDEVNINCGCPSERVTLNKFGVCLMESPELVLECVKALESVLDCPVTIKCRLGFDCHDSYEFLYNFIKTISDGSKCRHFVIHARKALLDGINPK